MVGGGNPTFIIPFKTLLIIFFTLTVFIEIGVIKLLKIFGATTVLITILEIVTMYILFWYLFR